MKHLSFILSLLVMSSVAHADLAQDNQEKCNTPEIQEMMGESGSCRIVTAPKPLLIKGACTGAFLGSLPCSVSYHASETGTFLNLTCGSDPLNPVISQDMPGEALGYNLALLVKNSEGKRFIIKDGFNYGSLSNRLISINIAESSVFPSFQSLVTIKINFQGREVEMTDLSCQQI